MNRIGAAQPLAFTDMTRVFDHFFSEPAAAPGRAPAAHVGALALDIAETDQHLIVRASLPGFRKQDVAIEVHDGELTITATPPAPAETSPETFLRRERRSGPVSRTLRLPDGVSHDQGQAELKDGVLELRLAKIPEARKRTIAVQ